MFLKGLLTKNRAFLQQVVELHQTGRLPANCYVIDLDSLEANTKIFTSEAHRLGLKVYAMSKQLGRGRPVLETMTRGGVDGFVAVDMDCARPITRTGHNLGHLGHLVQVSRAETAEATDMRPDFWTLYSLYKAQTANRVITKMGEKQRVMLRVWGEGDNFYPGHEGGFKIADLEQTLTQFDMLDGLEAAGVTSFPALLFNQEKGVVETTHNLSTIVRARQLLADRLGVAEGELELNTPGTTSTVVLEKLAEVGSTQVEPGHGLTGTTPLHAVSDLPEIPAVVYLSEVSHFHQGAPFAVGGGFYLDPVFAPYQTHAVVASGGEDLDLDPVPFTMPNPAGIDYYAKLDPPPNRHIVPGASVIAGFRIQAFFARALVAGIRGVGSGQPKVIGFWDDRGQNIDWTGAIP